MDCQQIQDQLFAADVYTSEALPADLKARVRGCAECRKLLARLMRLERATQLLGEPDSHEAKEAFFQQLQPVSAPRLVHRRPQPSRIMQIWPQLAMAASILLCIGLAIGLAVWRHREKPQVVNRTQGATPAAVPSAEPDVALPVVDRLVGWNVDLAEAESPEERAEIRDEAAELEKRLRQEMDSGSLSKEDGALASSLIETGKWLAEHPDPFYQAERFENIADNLLDRTEVAANKNDATAVSKLVRHYGLVASAATGINTKLENARKQGVLTPDQEARLKKMAKSNAALEEKLKRLLDKSPEAARKAISQTLAAEEAKKAKEKDKAKKDKDKSHAAKPSHPQPPHKDSGKK